MKPSQSVREKQFMEPSHSIPRIKYSNFSAPSTPLNSANNSTTFVPSSGPWSMGFEEEDLDRGSIGSIDEAEEVTVSNGFLSPDRESITSPKKKSKSRLSLNLGSLGRDDRSPSPTPKSPSIIPKFLRNSFSKLMSREPKKSESSVGDQSGATTPNITSPVNPEARSFGSRCPSISRDMTDNQAVNISEANKENRKESYTDFDYDQNPASPDTLLFLERLQVNEDEWHRT